MLNTPVASPEREPSSIDLPLADSVALKRLIAEVEQQDHLGGAPDATLYNRTYHRHNR